MSNPCYYHPQASAVGNCLQCGTPGCEGCLEDVGGKFACRRCSPALKSRLAAQAAVAAPPPPAPPANVRYGPDPGYDPALGIIPPPRRNYIAEAAAADAAAEAAVPQRVRASRLLLGLGLAGLVGVLGALGIEKTLFTIHVDIALLYWVLGAAVAGCLRAFAGRGGVGTAFLAAAVMLVCLAIGHWALAQDVLHQAQAAGGTGTAVTDSDAFRLVIGRLSDKHWAFALSSVLVCFMGGYYETKQSF